MQREILIAESGGSKTDWMLISNSEIKFLFTTASLHPNNLSEKGLKSDMAFWDLHQHLLRTPLYFYGSGCLNHEMRKKVSDYLNNIGFDKLTVESDLMAAGLALFGSNSGKGIIMGTGSVYFEKQGEHLENLKGGYGYLLGDEGSGYYFGKMLLHRYLNGKFSKNTLTFLKEILGDNLAIINSVYSDNGKEYIAGLSAQLSEFKNDPEIYEVHEDNIRLFVHNYLDHFESEIFSVVGSYAYHNSEILKDCFNSLGHGIEKIIERPINSLAEHLCSIEQRP